MKLSLTLQSSSWIEIKTQYRSIGKASKGAVLPQPIFQPPQQVYALWTELTTLVKVDGRRSHDQQLAVDVGWVDAVIKIDAGRIFDLGSPYWYTEEQARPAHILKVPCFAAKPCVCGTELLRSKAAARALHIRPTTVFDVVQAIACCISEKSGSTRAQRSWFPRFDNMPDATTSSPMRW
eukprot:CAMPEP_0115849856 /NCGR_PEP_ID=MMETSP0287-20121206/11665_1 /TAXON_ID=412157 /ORGANISM="Chrysochromulina rotalis, Strain UIO044" /LENGTH=178 /DNA_ID=CAMNT_0003303837 /DNA_START=170 /DNA_END=706 /DNA_ORIENTATION=+